jgi:HlyD family secretion protein
MVKKFIKGVFLVVLVAAAVAYVKLARTAVVAHEVESSAVVAEVMGTGTLEARIRTTISPRIQERLAEVLADQGDSVRSGQLLARLDAGEIKAQVAVAVATLSAAKSTVEKVKADGARAAAVEETARLNHKRASDLLSKNMLSQEAMDKAVEMSLTAEAEVKRVKAAVIESEMQVLTAEKSLEYQKERLSYTQITSPYDGLVVRRDRDPGGVVVPGGSLMLLVSTNEMWVSAWVDETASAGLRLGQPARVVFRSRLSSVATGEVARLGHETDRETREFLVDVRVKRLPENWTLGQRAEVYIETGRRESAVVVPQPFVQWRAGKPGVFVNEKGVARWRALELGVQGQGKFEVLKGLAVGEQVVRPPAPKSPELADGERVKAL